MCEREREDNTTHPQLPHYKYTHLIFISVFYLPFPLSLFTSLHAFSIFSLFFPPSFQVFQGTCFGQPVAIKTMLKVTEKNATAFRREILLTATLRHPNIVNFVGACWGRELMCLVLEWVPKGSLQDLLDNDNTDNSNHSSRSSSPPASVVLKWDDPLLKLATDVARGMAYLHGKEWVDEADCVRKRCILHRDLKPDNVLVTEFMSCKITDFGTSRAKAVACGGANIGEEEEGGDGLDNSDAVTMSAVGTPLYAAPEVTKTS